MKKLCVCLTAALVLLFTGILFAQTVTPSLTSIAPEDTLAFVIVKDIPGLQVKLKNYSLYDLWREPSVQRFLQKPLDRLNEEIKKAEGEAGMTLADVTGMFKGQAALLVRGHAEDDNPEVIILIDVGQDGQKARELINTLAIKIAEKANEPPLRAIDENYEGVVLTSMHENEGGLNNNPPNNEPEPAFTYGVAGNVLVAGVPLDGVKRTITFLNNPPVASLRETEEYKSFVEKVSDKSDIIGYVNLRRIIEMANRAKNDQNDLEAKDALAAMGFNGLTTAGLVVEAGTDCATMRLTLQTSGVPRGIVKILMPTPGELYGGEVVPSDAAGFTAIHVDIPAIWDEVQNILALVAPKVQLAMNAQFQALAQQAGQPFDLRNDVLAVFGPRIGMYARFEKPYALQTSGQTLVIADIASKAVFDATIAKLHALWPAPFLMLEQREYLGHQIYAFNTGNPRPNMAPTNGPRPAFVATQDKFIFASTAEALEAHLRWLRDAGPSLQDRDDFREILAELPEKGRIMVSFKDPVPQMELLLTELRDGKLAGILDRFREDPEAAAIVDLFDMALLPPPEDITRHMTLSAGCATVGMDGLMITTRSPARSKKAAVE